MEEVAARQEEERRDSQPERIKARTDKKNNTNNKKTRTRRTKQSGESILESSRPRRGEERRGVIDWSQMEGRNHDLQNEKSGSEMK